MSGKTRVVSGDDSPSSEASLKDVAGQSSDPSCSKSNEHVSPEMSVNVADRRVRYGDENEYNINSHISLQPIGGAVTDNSKILQRRFEGNTMADGEMGDTELADSDHFDEGNITIPEVIPFVKTEFSSDDSDCLSGNNMEFVEQFFQNESEDLDWVNQGAAGAARPGALDAPADHPGSWYDKDVHDEGDNNSIYTAGGGSNNPLIGDPWFGGVHSPDLSVEPLDGDKLLDGSNPVGLGASATGKTDELYQEDMPDEGDNLPTDNIGDGSTSHFNSSSENAVDEHTDKVIRPPSEDDMEQIEVFFPHIPLQRSATVHSEIASPPTTVSPPSAVPENSEATSGLTTVIVLPAAVIVGPASAAFGDATKIVPTNIDDPNSVDNLCLPPLTSSDTMMEGKKPSKQTHNDKLHLVRTQSCVDQTSAPPAAATPAAATPAAATPASATPAAATPTVTNKTRRLVSPSGLSSNAEYSFTQHPPYQGLGKRIADVPWQGHTRDRLDNSPPKIARKEPAERIIDVAPNSVLAPIPIPVLGFSPDPERRTDLVLNSVLVAIPTLVLRFSPEPVPISAPNLVFGSALDQVPKSAPDPLPGSVPNVAPGRSPDLDLVPRSTAGSSTGSIAERITDLVLNSVLAPIPTLVLGFSPEPVPISAPNLVFASALDPVPRSAPDPVPGSVPNVTPGCSPDLVPRSTVGSSTGSK